MDEKIQEERKDFTPSLPLLPATQELLEAIDACNIIEAQLKEIEAQLREAKQNLIERVKELPSKIGDNEDLQDEIFHQLYWFDQRVPAVVLKQTFRINTRAAAGKGEKTIRPVYLERQCDQCQQPYYVEVTGRGDLQSKNQDENRWKKKRWKRICDTCHAKNEAISDQEYERQQAIREARLEYLHTMPYYEYLQTPEWQEKRKRAMKRAGWRCQICNAAHVRLNTHHKTYERRGYEDDKDLIVLCEQCHGIFHESGKLAREER